ncbi:MAG: methylated-DNA--[Bacteroidales bacterium]|nr:methylated-DNA--[protein]-cysteine S-methyltransferase [Bacteroidales bacterium]
MSSFCLIYPTPENLDDIILTSDGEVLTGLRFIKQYKESFEQKSLPIFQEVCRWLDVYFSGREPDFTPKFRIENSTPFRREVLEILVSIPFGKTMTYGEIAAQIAKNHGIEKMSAQAVGGAVGKNPIGIIIPCHRVLGSGKSLTGYSGGIKNKIGLLKVEKIEFLEE